MTGLPIYPEPPESTPGPGVLVLGRFQPVHRGHTLMIEAAEQWRFSNSRDLPLIIAIGSSNRPESMLNPWTAEERKSMLEAWLENRRISAEIVTIPDIDDPPNWVSHAERYHGGAGAFYTTDLNSAELYESAGWKVILGELDNRESYEGWRIRATAQMMSTISNDYAILTVLSQTVPEEVVEHLIKTEGLHRLAFLGEGGEPVG